MRIGILTDRITPGAMPKIVGSEVRELRALGHDGEVVSIMETGLPAGEHRFDEYLAGIPIRYIEHELPALRRFDFRIPPFSFFAAFDLVAAAVLPRLLARDEHRYDLLIAHSTIAGLIAQQVRARAGIPYLAYVWDPITYILEDIYGPRRATRGLRRRGIPAPLFAPLFHLGRWVDRKLIDDAAVAVSSAAPWRDLILRYTGRETAVVLPGVRSPDTVPTERGDYLFTIDRWDVGNTPISLLDVLLLMRQPARLKIAGFWWPPALRDEFVAQVRRRGLEDRVELLGSVSEAALGALYAGARALVFPHYGGINFCVMEALAHGCPVVMQEGIDLLEDAVHAFLPPRGDLQAFAARTDELVADERLAYSMGQRGRALMARYSWRAHAERLLALAEAAGIGENPCSVTS